MSCFVAQDDEIGQPVAFSQVLIRGFPPRWASTLTPPSRAAMQNAQLVIHDDVRITPFWNRIPRFFLFPLQAEMLFVLVPLALSSLLGRLLPVPAPFDVLLVEGLIWLAALRHAFNVMERTSQGLLTAARQASALPQPERVNLPWKMIGVLIVWGLLLGVVGKFSPALAVVGNLFFMIAFPASVMALSATNSFAQAINPLLWLAIMGQVGKAYFALFVFLLLLSGGGSILMPMLAPLLGGWLTLPLVNFSFLYFNLIMFNMMGYVLYQFHRELGVDVKVGFDQAEAKEQGRGSHVPITRDLVGEEVAAKVACGDLTGALDAAYEQQRVEVDNIVAQERYHKLLLLADKKDRAIDHGRRYLSTLQQLGRDDLSFDLFKRLVALDEGFAPEPNQVLRLAQTAFRRRESALALALVRGFDRHNPRHVDVPGMYLLSARILSEHFRKDDAAGTLLRKLCQEYPAHPLAVEAEVYLKALDNLRLQPANRP
jgi:hypothetical protein